MRPDVWVVPEAVPIVGGWPLFSFGLLLGLTILLGWRLIARLAREECYDPRLINGGLAVATVVGLLGARLLHFATPDAPPISLAAFLSFDSGGMVLYGALLGGLLAAWTHQWWRGAPLLEFADLTAPAIALGIGISRLGCVLFGCDYGIGWRGPMGLHYSVWDQPSLESFVGGGSSPAYMDQIREGALAYPGHAMAGPVFPVQLLESTAAFALFALVLHVFRNRRYAGQAALSLAAGYAGLRFAVEWLRGDLSRGVGMWGLGLSTSQWISAGVIVLVVIAWSQQRGAKKSTA